MTIKEAYKLNLPPIQGFYSRAFQGASDFPKMAAIIQACSVVDQSDSVVTEETLRHDYRYLTHCDPYRDMIFAEIGNQTVAYGRVYWRDELEGNRIFALIGYVHPDWRRRGIARALIATSLRILKERGMQEAALRVDTQNPSGALQLYQSLGYRIVKQFITYRKEMKVFPQSVSPGQGDEQDC